ncbi:MAG TPA: large conductance mechanosensitive channel protein MscL [Ktedonobacterales bacterium]|nr:large conductance mechanosensitive channel protein MscL [Ktedonobacterales bacterium]
MKETLNEFKTFILRGNVVDLAIAVVVGAAFSGIVTSLVKDLITPLLAAIGGAPDFAAIYFKVNNSKFLIGDFVNSVVSFLIIATVIFFLVVKPLNWLLTRRKQELPPNPATRECPYCISEIPIRATRCAYCTAEVSEAVAVPVSYIGRKP